MMSIEEKLDELLEKHRHDYWDYCKNLIDSTEFEKREDKAKHQILELIKETLQECIGEEEPEYHDSDCRLGDSCRLGDRCYCVAKTEVHRNQLRREALTKLEEKLNQLSQQTLDK